MITIFKSRMEGQLESTRNNLIYYIQNIEGVSEFIVGACRLHPKAYRGVFDSKQFPFLTLPDVLYHNFKCGSSAEFYIEPINPCIDDIDLMMSDAQSLAFTDDIPVYPDDVRGFLEPIQCFRIKSNPDYPGFVQLQRLGNMRYDWHYKIFVLYPSNDFRNVVVDEKFYPRTNSYKKLLERCCVVGPALKYTIKKLNAVTDVVHCLWCPQWPTDAKNWPLRNRNYGWPTTSNIHEVVRNGCHIVFAKHRACMDDVHQCRLSFSVAEVILLQSLTPVQQIVYHMLRFFAKRELIKKDCPKEDEVLCTYHFKTLMLWSCEETLQEWWNNTSVIEICCNLLRRLSEWLKTRLCPNYFIPHANLINARMNQKIVNETIRRVNEFCLSEILSGWFAVNYIIPILRKVFIFGEKTIKIDLELCRLRICEMRDAMKHQNIDWQFSSVFRHCADNTFRKVLVSTGYTFRTDLNFTFSLMNLLWHTADRSLFLSTIEFSSRSPQFGKVLFLLHAAFALGCRKTTYDSEIFTELIREISWEPKVVRSKHHNFPRPSKTNLDRSGVLFFKVEDLMENLTGLNSPEEFKLVSQLSKELLRNALNCDLSNTSVIRDAAFVYLAALHFSESDYQIAIDLCSTVFNSQPPGYYEEDKQKETLNAGSLFYIDDVVRIIGFYLLFRQIRDNFQYHSRLYFLELRLTPEVFAHYLAISSNEKCNKTFRLNYDLHKPTFPLDGILMTFANRKCSEISKNTERVLREYQGTDKPEAHNNNSLPNEDHIIQLLMEYSLKTIEMFYNDICKDFDIRSNTADCYRAAYLYKCRKYPEALHLCERIASEPDLGSDLKELAIANVMVVPPLDLFFDRDIQCLLGLHTLVYYLSPSNEDLQKMEDTPKSTFQQYFARTIYSDKSVLADVLLYAYPKKCHYFLGRYFLARYLKLRCLMDYSNSGSDVMTEFVALKSHLPFEHVINCFLQQKLRPR